MSADFSRHGILFDVVRITALCQRCRVRELALFGSILRDDFRPDSDIDVLVEFEPDARPGLLRFVALQEELSTLLGRAVDLIAKSGLKPLIRDEVLASARVIYGDRATDPASWIPPKAPERRDDLYLATIRESADAIATWLKDVTLDAFLANEMLRSAVAMELIRLGLAASRVSPERRTVIPDLRWDASVDRADRLQREYYAIDWPDLYAFAISVERGVRGQR